MSAKLNGTRELPVVEDVRQVQPVQKTDKKMLFKWILLTLAISFFLFGALGMVFKDSIFGSNEDIPVTSMTNIFADVNGDGKIDYVLDAKVIINGELTNFILGQ